MISSKRISQTYQLSDLVIVQISEVEGSPILEKQLVPLGAVRIVSLATLPVQEAIAGTRERSDAQADGIDIGRVAPFLEVGAVAARVSSALDSPVERDEPEFNTAEAVATRGTAGVRVQTAALDAVAGTATVVVEPGIDSSCGGSEAEECEELHLGGLGKW